MPEVGQTWTTYRRKDGEPIEGMYGWVNELDFFADHGHFDAVELVEEVWVLQSQKGITVPTPCEHVWEDDECVECGVEREPVVPNPSPDSEER